MPSRILVVEKVNDSIDTRSSSSFNDRYDGDDTTLQNTSIALLPSTNKENLLVCQSKDDEISRDSSSIFDPDETRLDHSLYSEKIFDPNETSLDAHGSSQRHLIVDQTLHLTLTPIEHSKLASSPSPSKLISRFPEMTLESRNDGYDIQQEYENKYRAIIKKIIDDNRNVVIPSFSKSTDIDERLTHLYEIIESNENVRKVSSEIGWDKENVLPSREENILSSRAEETSKSITHPSTPEFLNIHESQEHSFNLSNANVRFDSNVKGSREMPSIEITRADIEPNFELMHSFQSPIASTGERQGMKRLASVSGKRGMDRKKGIIIHEHTPEDEKLVDDSCGDSDPFEAYNQFSQHVNDIMMDSSPIHDQEFSIHSEDNESNDDPSSFMESALQSQSSDICSISQNRKSSEVSSRLRNHDTSAISIEMEKNDTYEHKDLHNSFEHHEIVNDVNRSESSHSQDSVSSVYSTESPPSPHTMNLNTDSIIEEDNDNENARNISLQTHSRLCYNPLDVYRPPKWAKSYIKRKTEKNKPQEVEKKYSTNQRNQIKNDEPQHLPTSTWVQEPFKDFGSREADRMEVVSEWLNEKDDETNIVLPHRAVLLSLKMRQIISLGVQMVVHNGVHSVPQRERHLDVRATGTHYKAGTLIVARDKSCLLMWDCFLREKTSFSVLNHAELPSAERRRALLPSKASSYDIVLTTYDSLKTKEINTTVDAKGRAIPQTHVRGEWISSRASGENELQQQRNEAVSQLHTLEWYRLIFIDVLGRQGYLTKPATLRSQISVTLRGNRRIVFFEKSDDEHKYFFEDKIKESRRQLTPLAKLLDIPEKLVGDKLVGSAMLDYRDVKECHDVSRLSQLSDCSSILTEA